MKQSFGVSKVFEILTPWDVRFMLVITEEVAETGVANLPRGSRKCKLPEESEDMWTFPYYSFSACIAQCKVEAKMRLCNCTDVLVGYNSGTFYTKTL